LLEQRTAKKKQLLVLVKEIEEREERAKFIEKTNY
jgi:hypothetical protein